MAKLQQDVEAREEALEEARRAAPRSGGGTSPPGGDVGGGDVEGGGDVGGLGALQEALDAKDKEIEDLQTKLKKVCSRLYEFYVLV